LLPAPSGVCSDLYNNYRTKPPEFKGTPHPLEFEVAALSSFRVTCFWSLRRYNVLRWKTHYAWHTTCPGLRSGIFLSFPSVFIGNPFPPEIHQEFLSSRTTISSKRGIGRPSPTTRKFI